MMEDGKMISFNDRQLALVMQATAILPVGQRDLFLRSIAGRLGDLPYAPSNADIEKAIVFVLGNYGVAIGANVFRCNAELHHKEQNYETVG
jgi:hypothetical protein